MDTIHLVMSGETESMTSDEVKAWIMRQNFPPAPWDVPLDQRIADALGEIGFDRVGVTQTLHHPVFRVSARFGGFAPAEARRLKIAIRKMGRELGFVLRMSDIIVEVYTGRFVAVFALVAPDAALVEVEDDGQRVPEHLEFEEAA